MLSLPPERDIGAILRARPPIATLSWAAACVGDGARVLAVEPLRGGGACAVHALDVRDGSGRAHALVLKRFVRGDWVAREPDVASREARVLRALEPVDLPTPQLVGVDADGSHTDHPAVLMTRLPGEVQLVPSDWDAWLRGLAAPLPIIHGLPGRFRDLVRPYATYQDLDALRVPAWTRAVDAWRAIVAFVQRPAPTSKDCFVHRDYHPTNVLWHEGRVSGVLDWTNASHGPAAVDAGHCRLNLVQLHGVEVAERFRLMQDELAGQSGRPLDPTWDAYCLVEVLPEPSVYWGWIHLGVSGLRVGEVRSRLDAYAQLLAARL